MNYNIFFSTLNFQYIYRKVSIQLFTFEHPCNHSHSFLVASHKGGMTTSFGVYHVDPDRTTLRKMRQMIETRKDNGMVRRTLLFSEVLQTLSQSMNWHNYPRDIALFAYQFGIIVYKNGVNEDIPRVIRIEDEEMSMFCAVESQSRFCFWTIRRRV